MCPGEERTEQEFVQGVVQDKSGHTEGRGEGHGGQAPGCSLPQTLKVFGRVMTRGG